MKGSAATVWDYLYFMLYRKSCGPKILERLVVLSKFLIVRVVVFSQKQEKR